MAGRVGGVASDLAGRGTEMASTAADQAKTFASELENMARRNPIGALAGAVVIGVMIGCSGVEADGIQVLKLFGLDLPTKMEAAKSGLEQRIERATKQIKQVAQETVILAVLSVLAVITSAMAVAVGLIALYRWTADAYGEFAGLGVVGGTRCNRRRPDCGYRDQSKFASVSRMQARYVGGRTGAALNSAGAGASIPDALGGEPHPQSYVPPATATYPVASASDLVEPLTSFLGKS